MKILKFLFIAVATTTMLASCGDDGLSRQEYYKQLLEQESADAAANASPTIGFYLSNPFVKWAAEDKINVNGKEYATESLVDNAAKFVVDTARYFNVAYPSDFVYDASAGTYSGTLPATQQLVDGGIDKTTIIGATGIARGNMSFVSASIDNLVGYVTVKFTAKGNITAKSIKLSPKAVKNIAGDVTVNCSEQTLTVSGNEASAITIDCGAEGLALSRKVAQPNVLTFAMLPGTYEGGFDVEVTLPTGKKLTDTGTLIQDATVAAGAYFAAGSVLVADPDAITTMNLSFADAGAYVNTWVNDATVTVNGDAGNIISAGATATTKVTTDTGYSFAYPDSQYADGSYTMTVPASQDVVGTVSAAPYLLGGYSTTADMSVKHLAGLLKLDAHTLAGLNRIIKSVKVVAAGAAGTFTYNPSTNATAPVSLANEITVDCGAGIVESTDQTAPTTFCVAMLPGTYSAVKVEVTALDGSVSRGAAAEEKYYTKQTYDLGDITIVAGGVNEVALPYKVLFFDWIQANGGEYTGNGGFTYLTSPAAFINTGWVAATNIGQVEFEATFAGRITSTAAGEQRILFGAQGTDGAKNRCKTPALIFRHDYNGWYHIAANVIGADVVNNNSLDETVKSYHIANDGAKRTLKIGCAGAVGNPIYFKYTTFDGTDWYDAYNDANFKLSDVGRFRTFTVNQTANVYPVFIFALNNQAVTTTGGSSTGQNRVVGSPTREARIYNLKITFKNTLERDMVACTVDGIPGMYDKVEGKYYFNGSNKNADGKAVTVINEASGCYAPFIVGND